MHTKIVHPEIMPAFEKKNIKLAKTIMKSCNKYNSGNIP